MSRPLSPPIDRSYRTPKLKLPPGACDCHFHFIGPQSQFPLKPNHVFSHLDFEDTTIDDWLALQNALGLSRGLHVQSMTYGNNYELVLHGQCRLPDRLRAVCIPWVGITDAELDILTTAGTVGYRVTWRLEPAVDQRMVARVHEHGWQIHYLIRPGDDAWHQPVLNSPGTFVLEHMGGIEPSKGLDSTRFKFVQACLDSGRCWVKLSPRVSQQQSFPFDDVLPFVRLLVERYPDRLLWGTDWPHPQYFKPMPNDVDLLDQMHDWVPDESVRRRIFVDNPAALFGFPPLTAV